MTRPVGATWHLLGLLTDGSTKDSLPRSLLLKKHEHFLPSTRYSRSMKPTQPSFDKHCSPRVPLEREHTHLRWPDGPRGVTQAGGPLWDTGTPGLDIQARQEGDFSVPRTEGFRHVPPRDGSLTKYLASYSYREKKQVVPGGGRRREAEAEAQSGLREQWVRTGEPRGTREGIWGNPMGARAHSPGMCSRSSPPTSHPPPRGGPMDPAPVGGQVPLNCITSG